MLNILLSPITRRRAEDARVDAFVTAIRATDPAPRPAPARTDTASLPRLVLLAGVPLAAAAVLLAAPAAPASAATVAAVPTVSAAPHIPCHLHTTRLARLVCAFPEMVAATAHSVTPR